MVKSRTPIKSTLDATHNSRVDYFASLKKNLPILKKDLLTKQQRLIDLEKSLDMNLNLVQIQEKNSLRTQIVQLETRIADIESNKEELDYYLKAGQILFEYYSNGESLVNSILSKNEDEILNVSIDTDDKNNKMHLANKEDSEKNSSLLDDDNDNDNDDNNDDIDDIEMIMMMMMMMMMTIAK